MPLATRERSGSDPQPPPQQIDPLKDPLVDPLATHAPEDPLTTHHAMQVPRTVLLRNQILEQAVAQAGNSLGRFATLDKVLQVDQKAASTLAALEQLGNVTWQPVVANVERTIGAKGITQVFMVAGGQRYAYGSETKDDLGAAFAKLDRDQRLAARFEIAVTLHGGHSEATTRIVNLIDQGAEPTDPAVQSNLLGFFLEVLAHEVYVHVDPVVQVLSRQAATHDPMPFHDAKDDHRLLIEGTDPSDKARKMLAMRDALAKEDPKAGEAFSGTMASDLGYEAYKQDTSSLFTNAGKFDRWVKP